MLKYLSFCFLLFVIAFHSHFIIAQNAAGQTKAITTAVPFLLITPDSQSGGLGDAGVALTNNSNATHWNPAALSFMNKKFGAGISYTPWLTQLGVKDISLSYLSGFYNMGEDGAIGGSLRYFTLGEIIFTNEQGQEIGRFNANEFAIDASYSRKLSESFSLALGARFIYSNLAAGFTVGGTNTVIRPGIAGAADIAGLYNKDFTVSDLPMNVRAGFNISNIGSKIKYTNSGTADFIPTNMRLGYAVKIDADNYNSITFTNDFNKLLVPSAGGASKVGLISGMMQSFSDAKGGMSEEISEFTASMGMEYWYNKLFAARAGFFYEDPAKGARKYMTFGLGIRYNVLGFDFAYLVPFQQNHPLANTLRFSLLFDFEAFKNQ
jgi:hypothetical protein